MEKKETFSFQVNKAMNSEEILKEKKEEEEDRGFGVRIEENGFCEEGEK